MTIHFIGVGGIGLSALARLLKHQKNDVSGSDIRESDITKELQSEGIKINTPHNKDAIKNQDLIIHSAVIESDNVEIIEAKKQGLKIYSRKEALPLILALTKNYCVCAAHGKSTTTAMLSAILQSSSLIGAISKEFNSNFRYVDNVMTFEADESDESFVRSNPYCALVLNTEKEHMEYYDYNDEKFYNAYRVFLDKAEIKVINGEDEFLRTLDYEDAIKLFPSTDIKNVRYAIEDGEPYTFFNLKDMGEFKVLGFGFHTAMNASLAILAARHSMGIDEIKKNLLKYKGLKKRFDILQKNLQVDNKDKFVLCDDYAHHPTEIKATLSACRLYCDMVDIQDLIVVWQPHRYSRTVDNLDAFKKCFKGCLKLIILPVWSVNSDLSKEEANIDFAKEFEHFNCILANKVVAKTNNLQVYDDKDNLIDELKSGFVVGVGAGDITYQLRG